ncbi:MAG: hypothetical protein R6V19_02080 [Armatimonadota bacterium]
MARGIRLLAAVTLALIICCTACSDENRQARQAVLRGTLATYAGEPRTSDGHVDIPTLVSQLQEIDANTYDFLIWHRDTDWTDLKFFLEYTENTDLKVWVSLVPPSESKNKKSEPFGLDYVRWADQIGKLSAQYPHLVAWSIDDFTHNLSFYTPEYLGRMMDAAHAHNPKLAFCPCTYYPKATQDFADRYSQILDGLLFYYRAGSAGNNLTDPSLCDEELATLQERFGEDFPIVLGLYVTGHSRLGDTTVEYCEEVMTCGHENAAGVHCYCHQNRGTPKYDLIKRLFGEWSEGAQE